MKSYKSYLNSINYRYHSWRYLKIGWQTNRKIVVIESDDWGAIRMPSNQVLNALLREGIPISLKSGYNRLDTLASEVDLIKLGEVLQSVKDKKGNFAKMTLNCVLTNPDFGKILKDGFEKYHFELFTETLSRYPACVNSFKLWKEGIDHGIFQPQFHGREHLNVNMWLELLKKNVKAVRRSFDYEIYCTSVSKNEDVRMTPLRAYDILKEEECESLKMSIQEGLKLFQNIFGFESKSMIAPNYVWDKLIEDVAHECNVQFIQGAVFQNYSQYRKKVSGTKGGWHYQGEVNHNKQIYMIRNCFFEPSQSSKLDENNCLSNIQAAFNNKKPAIIGSHRLNYIGGLDMRNREENLKSLSTLLKAIISKWPEVEFMSSDELGEVMKKDIEK